MLLQVEDHLILAPLEEEIRQIDLALGGHRVWQASIALMEAASTNTNPSIVGMLNPSSSKAHTLEAQAVIEQATAFRGDLGEFR